jgi:organic radical activating enzyme
MCIGVKPGRDIPKISTLGKRKKITNIKPGDKILAVDENNKLTETSVDFVSTHEIDAHIELVFDGKPNIYCSPEHPWLTNRGWVEAQHLKENDEIMHFSADDFRSFRMMGNKNPMKNNETAKLSAKNTDYKDVATKISKTRLEMFKNGELKTIVDVLKEKGEYEDWCSSLSKRMTLNNPMHDPEVVKKSTAAHNKSTARFPYLSRIEEKFHKMCIKKGLPVDYVGRFDFPVHDKESGKNIYPDFIIRDTNQVIETYYSGGRYSDRDIHWQEKRKQIFENAGYNVVFVDFNENSKEEIEGLISSLIDARNGIRVTAVNKISNRKPLKVYNLSCSPHNNFIVNGMVTHNCGGHHGELVKLKKATWWCDSETVWKTSKDFTNQELYNKFVEFGQIDNIIEGRTHLIWTGGEPTMPMHVKSIISFMDFLREKHPGSTSNIYCEIETNGTLPIMERNFYNGEQVSLGMGTGWAYPYINQINCSPKLANSGMSKSMRINARAIKQIMEHENFYFKFVISTEDDIAEIQRDFIEPFNIHWKNIILMPGVDNLADLSERTAFLFDMCKKYGFRGVSRSQVLAWNKVTGV